jgi:5-methylcytosine-specific restriction endonuclease McrA
MIKENIERDKIIIELYISGNVLTQDIAKQFKISVRQVQRIAKIHNVVRTNIESNKIMSKHKTYYKLPEAMRVKRKHISRRVRYEIIAKHPFCALCGITAKDCRIDIDHIDNNATNNKLENLQVLCIPCNQGKRNVNNDTK